METLPQQKSQQLLFALHVAPIPVELENKLEELRQAIHDNRVSQESHFRSIHRQAPPAQQGRVVYGLLLSIMVSTILLFLASTYFM